MSFKVIWSPKSDKQIRRIEKKTRKRIYDKVASIRNNPYVFTKRLFGINLYSLRVGDYKVIMNIRKNIMTIFVVKVGYRKEVYERS